MNAREAEAYIRERLRVHAIRGELQPDRTYRVASESATSIRFVTWTARSRFRALRVELVTCRSLRFGEFRRANLFWAEPRRDSAPESQWYGDGRRTEEPPVPVEIRELLDLDIPAAHPDGSPLAVDEFLAEGFAVFGD